MQDELRKIHAAKAAAEEEERRFRRLAEEDPFNPEVQVRRFGQAVFRGLVIGTVSVVTAAWFGSSSDRRCR